MAQCTRTSTSGSVLRGKTFAAGRCGASTAGRKQSAILTQKPPLRQAPLFSSFSKNRCYSKKTASNSRVLPVSNRPVEETGTSTNDSWAQECRVLMDFDVEALTSRRVKFKKLKALCAKVGCPGVTTGEQMVLTLLAKLETCTEPVVETGTEWWQAEAPANFMDVHSLEELNQVLESSQEQNKLLVVEFYKQDCPACKSMYPKVLKIAGHYADVQFVKVDTVQTPEVVKPLGIELVPYFHMYNGSSGRLASFSCNLMQISRLKNTLEAHAAARCSLTCEWPVPQSWPWFGSGERPAVIRKHISRVLKRQI